MPDRTARQRATELTVGDLHLGAGAHVSCLGKGRRQRITPRQPPPSGSSAPGWPNEKGRQQTSSSRRLRGTRLSHDALARLVAKHAATAALSCPSLLHKRITPHATRHSAAMALVNVGVDAATVALWLGHQSLTTTSVYVHADLALKERGLARTAPRDAKAQRRYQPTDALARLPRQPLGYTDRLTPKCLRAGCHSALVGITARAE